MVVREDVAFLVVHEAGARAALAVTGLRVDGDHAGQRARRDTRDRARLALEVLRTVGGRDGGRPGGAGVVAVGRPVAKGSADASRHQCGHRHCGDQTARAALARGLGPRGHGGSPGRMTVAPVGVRGNGGRGRRPSGGAARGPRRRRRVRVLLMRGGGRAGAVVVRRARAVVVRGRRNLGRRRVRGSGRRGLRRGPTSLRGALGSGSRHGRYGRNRRCGRDRVALVALVLGAHSSFTPRFHSAFGKRSAVHVSAVSFSHNTSGHCKQDLCIRTPFLTSGKTVAGNQVSASGASR